MGNIERNERQRTGCFVRTPFRFERSIQFYCTSLQCNWNEISVAKWFLQCHTGMLGGGHYVAYSKNQGNARWYCYNDSSCKVEIAEQSQVHHFMGMRAITSNRIELSFVGSNGGPDWLQFSVHAVLWETRHRLRKVYAGHKWQGARCRGDRWWIRKRPEEDVHHSMTFQRNVDEFSLLKFFYLFFVWWFAEANQSFQMNLSDDVLKMYLCGRLLLWVAICHSHVG